MDPELGDLPDGDVLVSGRRIAAVGPGLDAPGAQEIDARGMIVAPGLVDTHWHMWNTLLRSMSGGVPGEDEPAGPPACGAAGDLSRARCAGIGAKHPPEGTSHGKSGRVRLSRTPRPGHGCRGRGPGPTARPRA
jgi:hypothetical protein